MLLCDVQYMMYVKDIGLILYGGLEDIKFLEQLFQLFDINFKVLGICDLYV